MLDVFAPKAGAQKEAYKIIKHIIQHFKKRTTEVYPRCDSFHGGPAPDPRDPNPNNYSYDTKRPHQPPEDHPNPSSSQTQFHPIPRRPPTKARRPGLTRHPRPHGHPPQGNTAGNLKIACCSLSVERREIKF